MENPNGDIFAPSESIPGVSWKDRPVGSEVTLEVTDWPELRQERNFETGQPEVWPDSGKPKMQAVVVGTVDGQRCAFYAPRGKSLFKAIEAAQQEAGALIAPGGKLTVRYTHDVPSTKGAHFSPARQFVARYFPPSAFGMAKVEPTTTPTHVGAAVTQQFIATPVTTASAAPATQLTAEQRAALAAAGVDLSAFAAQ